MVILDKSRALDRMIWASGRHAVVVPDEFSHLRDARSVVHVGPSDDHTWQWSGAPTGIHRQRRPSPDVALLRPAA